MISRYTYSADSVKRAVVDSNGNGKYHVGPFVYNVEDGEIASLESVASAGGRTYKTDSGYEVRYFITDHLGSVRAVVNADGVVVEQNDYMPYGTLHANSALQKSDNRYLYGGKELQTDFGINYYDSFARFQRTDGAFNSIDPKAENYFHISPYAYCAGNPVHLVDPNGSIIKIWYKTEAGQDRSFLYSGSETIPNNEFVQQVVSVYKHNKAHWSDSPTVKIVEGDQIAIVCQTKNESVHNDGNIFWNPLLGTKTDIGIVMSPATVFDHEADHAYQRLYNRQQYNIDRSQTSHSYGTNEEKRVITGSEQQMARANGEIRPDQVTRKNHYGQSVITESPTSIRINKDATKQYEKQQKEREYNWSEY